MAACPEEKSFSPKEPLKICSENIVNYGRRKNCYNELSNFSKNNENFSEISEKSNPDVNTLSEDEFLQLMIEASTFNKSTKQESALLKKLRIDNPITETEPSDKVKLGTHPQFPVHRNTLTSVGSQSLASGASHSRTVDGRKKHSRNLQKGGGIHQSQSLQDLMSSDLCRSKQRPRNAHRTHSLSSDEVSGIDTDSLTILKKLGKKSQRQSANKTNNFSDSVEERKNGMSNHCPLSEIGNSGVDSAGDSSPVEIEMEELKSDKVSDDESSGKEVERSSNGVAQGNSKFYVDCNDIDSTVSFPLKLVSSMDDQNCEDGGDPLKRFPIVPWPRPLQVQSFFSSLPMDADTFGSGNDKQILNADINDNPFTRNTRPSNLASFVSSTLMDYSGNNGSVSETKNRKNKRLRNSVNKGVLSENIAGHRGEEDIDSLLQFINSSDKKAKSAVKGNSQVMSTKSSLLHDNERKKSFGKEIKNCHKNVINVVKQDLKRSSSLENISSNKISVMSDIFLFEPRGSTSDLPTKNSKIANSDNSTGKILDINSNEENKFTQIGEKCRESSTSESSLHNSGASSSPEVSSFAADFYSTADVSSQTIEESGFSIVKKKQRKKHPSKRSESYRWRNAQAQRKKGMMLPLAESKCGKQDARRKSTSSVPHSEHSSADNSDLDSVHSLPVRGSVPHPTQPHPHTTPSSSSSTPQASYADIARMPTSSKLPSPSIGRPPQEARRGKASPDAKEGPSEKMPSPPAESDSADVKVRSNAKSTREINTQTEPESAAVREEVKTARCEESTKNECASCSSRKACACSKYQPKVKGGEIPPVIMDNMPPESNTCNVSFGFGVEEVLRMVPVSSSLGIEREEGAGDAPGTPCKSGEMSMDSVSELPSVNSKNNVDPCSKSSTLLLLPLKAAQKQDLPQELSSHPRKVCYGTDKNICYNETKVNIKRFNHSELTRFLGNEFYSIEKEIIGRRSGRGGSMAEYYVDSSEEA